MIRPLTIAPHTQQEKHDALTIDTAAVYGDSERLLGELNAAARFTLDTKLRAGMQAGGSSRAQILSDAATSRALLNAPVDVLYLHAPDAATPLEETLAAVDEVYRSGFFKRFGVSNFRAADVEAIVALCEQHGWVRPSVYQGNYSAVARRQESLLFPTLRKLGIAFYAYSPVAGGFLTKTRAQLEAGSGRFQAGASAVSAQYIGMFLKPSYLNALDEWGRVAEAEGVSRAGLAYRWVKFHSGLKEGDGVIIGASSIAQLEETLAALEQGPLSEVAVEKIEKIWTLVEPDAPLDVVHG